MESTNSPRGKSLLTVSIYFFSFVNVILLCNTLSQSFLFENRAIYLTKHSTCNIKDSFAMKLRMNLRFL